MSHVIVAVIYCFSIVVLLLTGLIEKLYYDKKQTKHGFMLMCVYLISAILAFSCCVWILYNPIV